MEQDKSVLTIVENVYYREPGEQPTMTELSHSRIIDGTGQVYERRLTATEEWQPLDCGWIEETSQLIIRNREGYFLQTNPTEEERKESDSKILEISFSPEMENECWLVYPTESMRGVPKILAPLFIRSQSGKTRFTLVLYPK